MATNGFASFQAEALKLHNKREEHAAIMHVINQHADCLEHLMQGLEKFFWEQDKMKAQIEALLDGHAQLTKQIERLESLGVLSEDLRATLESEQVKARG